MYSERPSRLGGAVVWRREAGPGGPRPVLPDGCMDLLWIDGTLLVAGPDTRAHSVGLDLASGCAGVRLPPGAAPALLGVDAHELRDLRVPLADVWQARRARPLAGRMSAAGPSRTGVPEAAALEELALGLAAASPAPDPLMRAVADALGRGATVAATAAEAGLGARRLHRRCLAAFGYGPKTLARILRLRRTLALVDAGIPRAAAAARGGCADQSHLARDMRALTGLTLTAYAALDGPAGADVTDP
ncbi:helix-turn-helix domain-containing protein [Streptomyces montanisoli]|uniref:Helix-turn-helix domain-containing protein n=1 Tax=Streptomyces montanisoli TaxID=2798581 RepID=A0A940RX56_9ACTN|nr:helix-turn-helix domain-containing protein [Streptomyces montanisoli]MBP0460210.1 helix-turn-helix domain-containing protein [Streptomyces montanisoli]